MVSRVCVEAENIAAYISRHPADKRLVRIRPRSAMQLNVLNSAVVFLGPSGKVNFLFRMKFRIIPRRYALLTAIWKLKNLDKMMREPMFVRAASPDKRLNAMI